MHALWLEDLRNLKPGSQAFFWLCGRNGALSPTLYPEFKSQIHDRNEVNSCIA